MRIFDRAQLRKNKSKAFAEFSDASFLYETALDSIQSRLFLKQQFEETLFLGMRNVGGAADLIESKSIKNKTFADSSYEFLSGFEGRRVLIDEEALPFAPSSFDLVVSLLNMHTLNLVPEFLSRISGILKPGGIFIGSLFGSKTLFELKSAFVETEIAMNIPSSMHVFPMTDLKEVANLAARSGFAEPVSDSEIVKVNYYELDKLYADLKHMGERNILCSRASRFLPRNFFKVLEKNYRAQFAVNEDGEELLPATFEIIYLTAFAL